MGLCLERVEEGRPLLVLGHEVDVPVELGHDQLANDKPQTYAVSIHLALLVFD